RTARGSTRAWWWAWRTAISACSSSIRRSRSPAQLLEAQVFGKISAGIRRAFLTPRRDTAVMTAVPRKELAMHSISLIAMSGAGALEAPRGTDVAWLLLRGRAEVRAREGDFTLVPGDWIA